MSNATSRQEQPCLPHTHRPATGLFFVLTFLLLTLIPASAYFEIGAKTFLQGERSEAALLYRCGMTATQYVPVKTTTRPAGYAPFEAAYRTHTKDVPALRRSPEPQP